MIVIISCSSVSMAFANSMQSDAQLNAQHHAQQVLVHSNTLDWADCDSSAMLSAEKGTIKSDEHQHSSVLHEMMHQNVESTAHQANTLQGHCDHHDLTAASSSGSTSSGSMDKQLHVHDQCQKCSQQHCQNLVSSLVATDLDHVFEQVTQQNHLKNFSYSAQHLLGHWQEILRPPKA